LEFKVSAGLGELHTGSLTFHLSFNPVDTDIGSIRPLNASELMVYFDLTKKVLIPQWPKDSAVHERFHIHDHSVAIIKGDLEAIILSPYDLGYLSHSL
jgi:hypothetical protein